MQFLKKKTQLFDKLYEYCMHSSVAEEFKCSSYTK